MKFLSKWRLRGNRCRSEKGQASIMMGILMLTFVFFFAFVVNTGMLVNAKINLQNAADLAAYAGAAVQARQLTQISYLNYEMRRQYKKFLFRYYVLGNMAQDGFPKGGGGKTTTPMKWIPDRTDPTDYKAPMVCMIWSSLDNICRQTKLRGIQVPKKTGFDAIMDTTADILQKVEDIRQNNCVKIGTANQLILLRWLWNTDPNFSHTLSDQSVDPAVAEIYALAKGLAHGIGLIPREIILKRRIDTLAEYVNQAPLSVTLDRVNSLTNSDDPAPNERTIQAFYSAYYTLGNNLFPHQDLNLEELMPPDLLKLEPIKAQFNAYAVNFTPVPGGCSADAFEDGVQTGIPLGVYKDTSLLTYYAIRLNATATLMFSPFGDLKLSAYSAAQPFGSRIGPPLAQKDFVRPNTMTLRLSSSQASNPDGGNNLPNLPIRDDNDTSQEGMGWDTQEAMGALFQAFNPPGADPGKLSANGAPIDQNALQRAYHYAMAPNEYEAARYNIPYDGDDPFVRNFDSNHMMSFWAPIFPASKMNSMDSELKTLLAQYVTSNGTANQQAELERIKKEFELYIQKLIQGAGEAYDLNAINTNSGCVNCEGFKVVRIADPVNTRPEGGIESAPITSPFAVTPADKLRSSWADIWDADMASKGRIGYSVKFVSFKYLSNKVETSPGQNSTNRISGDEQFQQDLPHIKH